MNRSSKFLRAMALGLAAALMTLGASQLASASMGAKNITAGPVKATAGGGNVLPTTVACPPGKSVAAETCDVIGTDSSNARLLDPVVRGTPKQTTMGGGFVASACWNAADCLFVWSNNELDWGDDLGNGGSIAFLKNSSSLAGVACVSTMTCVVVGVLHGPGKASHGVIAVVKRTEGSPSATEVPGVAVMNGVACAGPTKCYAAGSTTLSKSGSAVVVPIINGRIQARELVRGSDSLHHVSCGAASSCWATGTSYSAKTGVTTAIVPIGHGTPGTVMRGHIADAITCISATTCLLASGTGGHGGPNNAGYGKVDELTNGTLSGQLTLYSFFGGPLTGIACPTATSCMAAGRTSLHTGGVVSLHV